jgi:hypothetical protein
MLPRRARRMAQTSGPPARPRRTGTGKPARAAGSEPTTIPSTMPQGAKFVTASSWAEFPSSAATRSGDGHRRRRSTHRRTADGHLCWPSFRYLFAQPGRHLHFGFSRSLQTRGGNLRFASRELRRPEDPSRFAFSTRRLSHAIGSLPERCWSSNCAASFSTSIPNTRRTMIMLAMIPTMPSG